MSTINTDNVFDSLGLSQSSASKTEEDPQDQFMKLMLAQLQNQDPMQPMENGEFLTQMAQFQTATSMQNMEQTMSSLSESLQSQQALQASSLVGHQVLAPGGIGQLTANGLKGTVDLPTSAADVKLSVYDANGALVKQIDMGTLPSGSHSFTWEGTDLNGNGMPQGNYQVVAEGYINNEAVAFNTSMAAQVESVSIGNNGQSLVLNLSGLGSVKFEDITEIM